MLSILKKVIAGIQQLRKHQSPTSRRQPVQLSVETMEARLVPSTINLPLPSPNLTPALQGSPVSHMDSSSGASGEVDPDQVCGYKHRGRCPPAPPPPPQPRALAVDVQHVLAIPSVATHLVAGAADGVPVLISSNGHIVPPPPPSPD
jgi:hypothetical protein